MTAASNDSRTVWADISIWQRVVTNSYPEPMLAFRADTGGSTDTNAAANWAWCKRTDRLKVALAYVVLIPGHETAILARLITLFGEKPPAKLAVMIDMESGEGFAGRGDHSASGNKMATLLAEWLGDRRRVVAYANRYDFQSNWPGMADWLHARKVTASYGSLDPGTWGHQYYGGVKANPSPTGLPRSMPPFGSNVDLNVTHRSIAQVAADFGLTAAAPPKEDTLSAAEVAQINAHTDAAVQAIVNTNKTMHAHLAQMLDTVASRELGQAAAEAAQTKTIAQIHADVDAIVKAAQK